MNRTVMRGLGLSAIIIVPILALAAQEGTLEGELIWYLILAVPFGLAIAFAGEFIRGTLNKALGPKKDE